MLLAQCGAQKPCAKSRRAVRNPVARRWRAQGAGRKRRVLLAGDDQHNDRSARLEIDDRLVQGRLALAVEVRVRLVEDDKERVAIQGACERDALPLPPPDST